MSDMVPLDSKGKKFHYECNGGKGLIRSPTRPTRASNRILSPCAMRAGRGVHPHRLAPAISKLRASVSVGGFSRGHPEVEWISQIPAGFCTVRPAFSKVNLL